MFFYQFSKTEKRTTKKLTTTGQNQMMEWNLSKQKKKQYLTLCVLYYCSSPIHTEKKKNKRANKINIHWQILLSVSFLFSSLFYVYFWKWSVQVLQTDTHRYRHYFLVWLIEQHQEKSTLYLVFIIPSLSLLGFYPSGNDDFDLMKNKQNAFT